MEKVLVTGANGFVGSNMCKLLLNLEKYEVHALIRTTSDLSTLKLLVSNWKDIQFHYGDLRNYNSLLPIVQNMKYIFHIAGIIKGSTPQEFQDGNYHGTCNLIQACLEQNPTVDKFIVTSSMVARGPGTIEQPQCEDTSSLPLENDLYGTSKFLTECATKQEMDKLPLIIIRPPTVIGPGDKVSLDLFKTAKMGLKIFVAGKPRPFSLVHVEDLVRGIYLCSQVDIACNQTFNFACHGTIPYRDLHEAISTEVFGRQYGRLIPVPIPFRVFYGVGILMEAFGRLTKNPPFLNRSKAIQASAPGQTMRVHNAKKILQWEPKYSIRSAIRHAGNWYLEHGWL